MRHDLLIYSHLWELWRILVGVDHRIINFNDIHRIMNLINNHRGAVTLPFCDTHMDKASACMI